MRGTFPAFKKIRRRGKLPARACALAAACWLASQGAAYGQAEKFEFVKVAEGVYAAVRSEPLAEPVDGNSVVIVNDDDVVVVDANFTPSSARAVLAGIRRLTAKPVRYVVNTHWHGDHVFGNQVYREAFP